MDRRELIKSVGLGLGILSLGGRMASGQEHPSYAKASPMKLGMVTYKLGQKWDINTIIENCEKTGFEGVELRATHAHGVELNLSKAERQEVKKRFEGSEVELMGLGSAYDFHTPDPEKLRRDIEACKQYMVLAHDVGASGVKVRPNGFPQDVPKEQTLEQIGASCRELGEFGKDIGVEIRMEVHGRDTALLPTIKKMMDYAGHSNVGVCWNSNSSDLAGQGFDYNFNLVKDKIFTVHINNLSNQHYPYRKLFQGLIANGYTGYCLCEVHSESKEPIRFMNYYRALWLAYQNRL